MEKNENKKVKKANQDAINELYKKIQDFKAKVKYDRENDEV